MNAKDIKIVKVAAWVGTNESDVVWSAKNGTVRVRRTFFYSHGMTSQKWASQVQSYVGGEIESHHEIWNQWPKDSYFEATIAKPDIAICRQTIARKCKISDSEIDAKIEEFYAEFKESVEANK